MAMRSKGAGIRRMSYCGASGRPHARGDLQWVGTATKPPEIGYKRLMKIGSPQSDACLPARMPQELLTSQETGVPSNPRSHPLPRVLIGRPSPSVLLSHRGCARSSDNKTKREAPQRGQRCCGLGGLPGNPAAAVRHDQEICTISTRCLAPFLRYSP